MFQGEKQIDVAKRHLIILGIAYEEQGQMENMMLFINWQFASLFDPCMGIMPHDQP